MTGLNFSSNDREKSKKNRAREKTKYVIPRVLHHDIDSDREKEILNFVIYREEIVSRLNRSFRAYKNYEPYSIISVFQDLILLRRVSLDVIDNILKWRKGLVKPEAFIIRRKNYLLKMITDTDFLLDMQILKTKVNFEIGDRNTFSMPIYFTHKYTSPEEQKQKLRRIASAPMYGDLLSEETFKDVETDRVSPFAQLLAGYQRQQEEEEIARQEIKKEIKAKLFREKVDEIVTERRSLLGDDDNEEEGEEEERGGECEGDEEVEEEKDQPKHNDGEGFSENLKHCRSTTKKKRAKKLDLPNSIEK